MNTFYKTSPTTGSDQDTQSPLGMSSCFHPHSKVKKGRQPI
ncbi:MAG: hypothetical protein N6V49_10340 [Serratia symbiotica]|nr:hypothetical protein [Serratia symbiotica]